MEKIALGKTGRKTSRLGFGCSSLMGAMNRKESLAILESAYDAGVRHFDVAPMYGFGQAEGCVGEFLRRHRADVTITTKYGIPPAKHEGLISLGLKIARPIVKLLPGVKQSLTKIACKTTAPTEKASFTAAQAKSSLDRSLAELQTDHIDVWLLHEVQVEDLQDDRLLRMLEDSVTIGAIGTFGVGSDRAKVEALTAARPDYCLVVQFEWSVFDRPVSDMSCFRMHHRSLSEHFRVLCETMREDKVSKGRWSEEVGADLADREMLAALMLKASLVENPDSVILVSSKNLDHIRHNVAVAGDPEIEVPARRLYEVLRRKGSMSANL